MIHLIRKEIAKFGVLEAFRFVFIKDSYITLNLYQYMETVPIMNEMHLTMHLNLGIGTIQKSIEEKS